MESTGNPNDVAGGVALASGPRASIVIPAHNESSVIERCLSSILESSDPGEFEIVVVCNGCTDDTAERARRFGHGINVLETAIRSKTGALNLGDKAATAFPRFYVDADIQISPAAIREVADLLLGDPTIVVAAPRAVVASGDSAFPVRAFYRVWTKLPYFSENMIGSGVYAFSRQGRQRFDGFPEITADDEFARLIAAPEERRSTTGAPFTIHAPRTLAGLLEIMTRARSGMYEFRREFPELIAHNNTDAGRSLRTIASHPSMWLDAPIYLGVMLVAKMRAERRLREGGPKIWERDETSRQPPKALLV